MSSPVPTITPLGQIGLKPGTFGADGLDTLYRKFSSDGSAQDTLLAAAARWSADADFPKMFLAQIAPNQGRGCDLEYIYKGILKVDGDGNPILPLGKHESDKSVNSASSSSTGIIGSPILIYPINIQYYAPRRILTWISEIEGTAGPSGSPSDPPDVATSDVTHLTWLDAELQNFPNLVDSLLFNYFHSQLLDVIKSDEIVPGKYWLNQRTKTKILLPGSSIFEAATGDLYFSLSFKRNSGDSAADFVQFFDSGTGKIIGIQFDGINWVIHTDVGGGATTSLTPPSTDWTIFHTVQLQVHPNGNGTWTATATIDGTAAAPITGAAMHIDHIRVGAIGAGTFHHNIADKVRVGLSSGGSQLFYGNIVPGPYATIVPPYTSVDDPDNILSLIRTTGVIQIVGTTSTDAWAKKVFASFDLS